MYDFNDALAKEHNRIKFITARHEQGAGYMAFGYAKSTGKPQATEDSTEAPSDAKPKKIRLFGPKQFPAH